LDSAFAVFGSEIVSLNAGILPPAIWRWI